MRTRTTKSSHLARRSRSSLAFRSTLFIKCMGDIFLNKNPCVSSQESSGLNSHSLQMSKSTKSKKSGTHARCWCLCSHHVTTSGCEASAVIQMGVPTFGGSCSPQVVNGSQDEPQGLLLFTRDAQHLHGCLQLGELLRGSLLVLRLEERRSDQSLIIHWSLRGRWKGCSSKHLLPHF